MSTQTCKRIRVSLCVYVYVYTRLTPSLPLTPRALVAGAHEPCHVHDTGQTSRTERDVVGLAKAQHRAFGYCMRLV